MLLATTSRFASFIAANIWYFTILLYPNKQTNKKEKKNETGQRRRVKKNVLQREKDRDSEREKTQFI